MAHCYVQILKPKQSVSLPIRSVHIKPSPVETDPTDVLLGLSRGKPKNPVNRKQATLLPRAEDSFGKSPTRRLRFLTSDRLLGTRAALKASTSTDLLGLRIWWSYDVARATWVSASPSRAGRLSTLLPRVEISC